MSNSHVDILNVVAQNLFILEHFMTLGALETFAKLFGQCFEDFVMRILLGMKLGHVASQVARRFKVLEAKWTRNWMRLRSW